MRMRQEGHDRKASRLAPGSVKTTVTYRSRRRSIAVRASGRPRDCIIKCCLQRLSGVAGFSGDCRVPETATKPAEPKRSDRKHRYSPRRWTMMTLALPDRFGTAQAILNKSQPATPIAS